MVRKTNGGSGDVIRRVVDTGAMLTFSGPGGDGIVALETIACDNPECECLELEIVAGWARESERDKQRVCGPVRGTLDVGTRVLKMEQGPDVSDEDKVLGDWLRAMVQDRFAVLRERFVRIKGSRDREQWREQGLDLQVLSGGMIGYCEVFPHDWDLVADGDDARYWAFDQYCMQPGCDCHEAAVSFINPALGETVGLARVDLKKFRVKVLEGGPRTRMLAQCLLSDEENRNQAALRSRYQEMRRVANEFAKEHVVPQAVSVKLGRNDKCPCGSGKKYKQCCLGKK